MPGILQMSCLWNRLCLKTVSLLEKREYTEVLPNPPMYKSFVTLDFTFPTQNDYGTIPFIIFLIPNVGAFFSFSFPFFIPSRGTVHSVISLTFTLRPLWKLSLCCSAAFEHTEVLHHYSSLL